MNTPNCSLDRGARGLSHSAAAVRTLLIRPSRHSSPNKTAQQHFRTAVVILFSSLISSLNSGATLLPDLPKGVSVLNSGGRALRDGILENCNVDMISLGYDWAVLEPADGTYVWSNGTETGYLDGDLAKIHSSAPDKAVLLRIFTMGGCDSMGGNTPSWVFDQMGAPCSNTTVYGVTYNFTDGGTGNPTWIPVFWNPVYLAKKKTLIAMAGAHINADSTFSSQVQVVAISYANAMTEDWYVPHDPNKGEVDLWLGDPSAGGAGYTTQRMIDAAIHEGDATFTDGVFSGTTLTSASATFTQADVGHQLGGDLPHSSPPITIQSWVSPTQVTLSHLVANVTGRRFFTIIARRDGLIDVAMAAFPNQYITTAVGGNGNTLDEEASGGINTGIYLAEAVDKAAAELYGNRYIVQRNNVTAVIPTSDNATDAWKILSDYSGPTAGQALSNCQGDDTFQMNGGNNCNQKDPTCPSDSCTETCVIKYQQELDYSGEQLATYGASYYEVYYLDAGNLCLGTLHSLLTGDVCNACPTPTPSPRPRSGAHRANRYPGPPK